MASSSTHQNGIKKPKIEKENKRIIIDDIAGRREWHPIPLINNINNNTPKHFNYINFNSLSAGTRKLISEKVTAQGCSCEDECDAFCACERSSSVGFDPDTRIVPNPDSYNFYTDFYVECGSHCNCFGTCKRQILPSNNVLKKLEAHYIKGKQFGIVAAQPIAAGMPIVEYVGEVFVFELEGDIFPRSHYQQEMLTNNENYKFIIDARKMGNIARFINHSCFPNVLQICVYPSIPSLNRTPPLPKVALVAARDILPGQELCFDYRAWYFLDRGFPCLCYEPLCHVPPYDHHEKARSIDALEKEIEKNKRKMVIADAGDLQPPLIEID
uniref:SET domain-containing protein n=1 Tax=Panagrolaimus sp. PS1159 TaxID=55785 RepID=A0AC35G498_9BILA